MTTTLQTTTPPAWTVSVGGHGFELGAPLHPATMPAVDVAWRLLLSTLRDLGVALDDVVDGGSRA
jgi:hypothetical protein